MPQFHVRLAGDDLVFSAGHFITLADGRCERLHGHSYRVAAEISARWAQQVRGRFRSRRAACCGASWPSWIIACCLPTVHPAIRVSSRAGEVEVTFAGRRWVFPQDDCLLLPMANTTTELLAQYVGERLLAALAARGEAPGHGAHRDRRGQRGVGRVRIAVTEGGRPRKARSRGKQLCELRLSVFPFPLPPSPLLHDLLPPTNPRDPLNFPPQPPIIVHVSSCAGPCAMPNSNLRKAAVLLLSLPYEQRSQLLGRLESQQSEAVAV